MSQSPCDDGEPEPPWSAFSQDGTTDVPPPGLELTALIGGAVANLDQLDEAQLLGVASAARRAQAYDGYVELMAVAKFGRRRLEQLEASKARGDRVRSRDGEYPAEELGFEMTASAYSAAALLDMAANIVGRLPSTLAGMAEGKIDRDRARTISNATLHLSDELAAEADKVLAEAAPEMRLADLHQRAARLEVRLDPEGVQKRKDEAKQDRRVELRREDSGAASLGGRELDPAEAIAGKASIDAEAVRLRNAGLPGTLAQIRAVILMDRIHQRNPWDRLAPLPEQQPEPDADYDDSEDGCDGSGCGDACGDSRDPAASPDTGQSQPADPDPEAGLPDDPHHDDPDYPNPLEDGSFPDAGEDDEEEDEGRRAGLTGGAPPGSPGDQTGRKTPMPALINITVPVGTLLGWSDTPADVGSWGLLDAATVRDLIEAASRHPRTRWCYTLTGQDGEAIAHACARGSHPSTPSPTGRDGPAEVCSARLAELLTRLNAAPEPIARGTCDHAHREDRYIPGRKLKHLIRARTARCCAPGCGAQAITSEIDHTIPYPVGASCECNLSPACQRHHHAKHAPGWKLQQTQPGVMQWTTPSGRTYTTHLTQYED